MYCDAESFSAFSDNEYFCYQGLKDGHKLKSSGATMTVSLRSKVNFKLF